MEVFGLLLDKKSDENLHCLFLYVSFFQLLPVKILIFNSELKKHKYEYEQKVGGGKGMELEDLSVWYFLGT